MIKFDIVKIDKKTVSMLPEGVKMQNMSKELDDVIKNVSDDIKNYVCGQEFFRNFAHNFENKDKRINARSVAICVERDETVKGNVLMLVSLLHPQLDVDASAMIASGSGEQLLEIMNKPNFKENVQELIKKLSNSFQ